MIRYLVELEAMDYYDGDVQRYIVTASNAVVAEEKAVDALISRTSNGVYYQVLSCTEIDD